MIFQVISYDVCAVTGNTDVTMTWDAGLGHDIENRFFVTEAMAIDYIFSMSRDAILLRLERFLKNVKQITTKPEEVEFLWSKLYELNKKDFKAICLNINYLKDRIYSTIPGEKFNTETALHRDANEILTFAKSNCEARFENFINPKAA